MKDMKDMKNIEAIFLDLDGTSLLPDHTISRDLVKMLDHARSKNIEIVVCTGRTYSASILSLEQMKIKNFVINYNGGRIFDLSTQEILHETSLRHELVSDLIHFTEKNNLLLNLYHNDVLYASQESEEADLYRSTTNSEYHVIDLKDFIGKTSIKALVSASEENSESIINLLKNQFPEITIVTSSHKLIEILPKGVNKSVGVEFVLNKIGIDPKNTMAFGDQWNDLEMLNFVEHGFLMGNAPDDLKKEISSVYHTLSNTEDGIVHILKQIL